MWWVVRCGSCGRRLHQWPPSSSHHSHSNPTRCRSIIWAARGNCIAASIHHGLPAKCDKAVVVGKIMFFCDDLVLIKTLNGDGNVVLNSIL